jgi:hypothetical protein
MIEHVRIIVLNHLVLMGVNALDYVQHIIVDVNHLTMEQIAIKVKIIFYIRELG